MRLPFSRMLLLAGLAVAVAAADDHADSIRRWRTERVARLTAPEGWLSLVGLHWLEPGGNTIGTGPDNSLRLAAGPDRWGTVTLESGGAVRLVATAPGTTVDGQPATGPVELRHEGGPPTTVRAGTVSFFVIRRGDRLGLRVRDSASPRRTGFAGIDYFEIGPSWRIEADWVPFDPPREIPVTNMLGQTSPAPCPGKAVFTRAGRTVELLPIAEGPGDLFFVFADLTSGRETYGACRFLYASPPSGGKVVLDFNRAQNPPCAFTPFATCPLPPKGNHLPFRVEAGEKDYRGEPH